MLRSIQHGRRSRAGYKQADYFHKRAEILMPFFPWCLTTRLLQFEHGFQIGILNLVFKQLKFDAQLDNKEGSGIMNRSRKATASGSKMNSKCGGVPVGARGARTSGLET